MKTFRNLMLLFVTASSLSSCFVQEPPREPRGHRHGHGHYHKPHRGHW